MAVHLERVYEDGEWKYVAEEENGGSQTLDQVLAEGNDADGQSLENIGAITVHIDGIPLASDVLDVATWTPNAEVGVVWGVEDGTSFDIVALVKRPSDDSVWASEYGGIGSGKLTGPDQPTWDDFDPMNPDIGVPDNDYTWFPVDESFPATVPYTGEGMEMTPTKLIEKAGFIWASFPNIPGAAAGLTDEEFAADVPPGIAVGAADYLNDGDGYWWPLGSTGTVTRPLDESDVAGLVADLASKLESPISQSDVTGLVDALEEAENVEIPVYDPGLLVHALPSVPGVCLIGQFGNSGIGEWTPTADTLYYMPFTCLNEILLPEILCRVGTGGGATAKLRIGLYAADYGQPQGSPIYDSGDVDISASVLIDKTPARTLPAGSYVFAIMRNNVGSPGLSGFFGVPLQNPVFPADVLGLQNFKVAQAYGAMPDPAPLWPADTGFDKTDGSGTPWGIRYVVCGYFYPAE